MSTRRPMQNKIYTWQHDKYMPVKSYFKAMEDRKDYTEYNPNENAQNVARLFMYSLPSNTLDILLDSIAFDLLKVYKDNPDFMTMPNDIQNRIRGTLDDLCHSSNITWKEK